MVQLRSIVAVHDTSMLARGKRNFEKRIITGEEVASVGLPCGCTKLICSSADRATR